jgi:hypothetical protein
MLYREIMAVCSEIHTKHINTQCGQNVELLNVKLVVNVVTTGLTPRCYVWLALIRALGVNGTWVMCLLTEPLGNRATSQSM